MAAHDAQLVLIKKPSSPFAPSLRRVRLTPSGFRSTFSAIPTNFMAMWSPGPVKSLAGGPFGDQAIEFVDFKPEGTDEVLLRDHYIGILGSSV
jgi:hypothetical protein